MELAAEALCEEAPSAKGGGKFAVYSKCKGTERKLECNVQESVIVFISFMIH